MIPFLPSLVETLEEDGHLALNEEHRRLLLSMSAATADRLLQAHRYSHPHGLATTKAGPLLKQQIPIRTFAQWDETAPGFLEVDLVAHCGGRMQGRCLYTITLTDIATGWTECLPLLNRGRAAILAALRRARTRFPFPILGLDTDNGGEFINEEVAAYCVREPISGESIRPSASLCYCPQCQMRDHADHNASLRIGQRLIERYQEPVKEKPHALLRRAKREPKGSGVEISQDAKPHHWSSTDAARRGDQANGDGTPREEGAG